MKAQSGKEIKILCQKMQQVAFKKTVGGHLSRGLSHGIDDSGVKLMLNIERFYFRHVLTHRRFFGVG